MHKTITEFNVNKFKVYLFFGITLFLILIYALINTEYQNSKVKFTLIILSLIFLLLNNCWLIFGKIKIITNKDSLIIQKKIFDFIFFEKKIKKPFETELVCELETDYYIGLGKLEFFKYRFTHKKGLIFYNKQNRIIYKIGINDKVDAEKIFDEIK